jgi:hypothetical protein
MKHQKIGEFFKKILEKYTKTRCKKLYYTKHLVLEGKLLNLNYRANYRVTIIGHIIY